MICFLYCFVSRFMKWINCFEKKIGSGLKFLTWNKWSPFSKDWSIVLHFPDGWTLVHRPFLLLLVAVEVHLPTRASEQLLPLLDALADLVRDCSIRSWHDSSGYDQDDKQEVDLVPLPSKHWTIYRDTPEYLLYDSNFFVLLKLKTNKM